MDVNSSSGSSHAHDTQHTDILTEDLSQGPAHEALGGQEVP